MLQLIRNALDFFSQLKKRTRRFFRRFKRWLNILVGLLTGALVALIGGVPGFLIGLLMGYMLGKLFIQLFQNRKILAYLKSPGLHDFYEGEPGLAAWCALGVLVLSANYAKAPEPAATGSFDKKADKSLANPFADKILRQLTLESSSVFNSPLADPNLAENFTRLAWSIKNSLNSDLLAESLAARRFALGDAGKFGRSLYNLAETNNAQALAREVFHILDPQGEVESAEAKTHDGKANRAGVQDEIKKEPWKILGIPPETPLKEVKTHYRRLAKQFHPDELEILEPKQKEAAARAFIKIQEAYKHIAEMYTTSV